MCLIYRQIDIKRLPTTNPFFDDLETSQEESFLPQIIVVDSPDSQRHKAWENVRRFPSLNPLAEMPASQPQPQASSDISIHGPRRLAAQFNSNNNAAYEHYRLSNKHTPPPQSPPKSIFSGRKIQRKSRVDSFPDAIRTRHNSSSASSTNSVESVSPLSENGFALQEPAVFELEAVQMKAHYADKESANSVADSDSDYLRPAPLQIRSEPSQSERWMNDLTRNW